MKTKIFICILLVLLIFSRFYNLNKTARFLWDESMDLVKVHELFLHPKLTLIGPIPEDNTKVFSSLTYYLFLPFTIIFKFTPISTAYSTAFFGITTIILLNILLHRLKKFNLVLALVSIIFLPLLTSSRWAWNPNFIPFWQALGFILLYTSIPFHFVLSGLIFGLTIHQHWYALFSCLGLIFFLIFKFKNRRYVLQFVIGLFLSILPFIIFDLTHPPGLFITRMLFFSPLSPTKTILFAPILSKLIHLPLNFIAYFFGTQNFVIEILILIIIIIGLFRSSFNSLLIPVFFQIIGLSLISGDTFTHYYLPAALPFLLWLFLNYKNYLSKLLLLIIAILFLFNIRSTFYNTDWTNNIEATNSIVKYITLNYSSNFNILVIGSPDPNTKGRRYRDLLSLNDIHPASADDYQNIDTLFVISYQSDWTKLSRDPAYELDNFRVGVPITSINIPNSNWIVYQLSKNNR